jgi:4-aminobutyrate aminotransferase-like enzyme
MGAYFFERLGELKEKHKLIGEVRGKGLFIGLELIRDPKTKTPAVEEAKTIRNKLKDSGLLLIQNESTFRILPPLTVERFEIDMAIELIDKNLKNIEEK